MKTEQGKTILQHAANVSLQQQIHLNYVIRDKLKKRIKQLKDKITESITPKSSIMQKTFIKMSIQKFNKKRDKEVSDELISKITLQIKRNELIDMFRRK